jgi:glycosyltransferase involved in cell wall biosynthesis
MRIAVANLTSGGLSGGYRKYLARLMPLIASDRRVERLTVFLPGSAVVPLGEQVDVRAWTPDDARQGYVALARDIAQLAPDVVFIPTARHASFGRIPTVTMVRNMEPLTVPFGGNSVKEGIKNVARAWEARRASRRATRVIAVSEHVRDFIITRWRIDPVRVGMVYHGVDRAALVPRGVTTDPAVLLTAGSIRPARGLEDLVRALPLIDGSIRLVIAGQVDPGCEGYAARLRQLTERLGVSTRVMWAGQLGSADMFSALQSCTAFVMTSRAEACPNTALEAMSHGCAVVSVDRAPMPEFFSDAALYYPTGDAPALAGQLRAIVADNARRQRLAEAASHRAKAFTWEATKDRTIQELELAQS